MDNNNNSGGGDNNQNGGTAPNQNGNDNGNQNGAGNAAGAGNDNNQNNANSDNQNGGQSNGVQLTNEQLEAAFQHPRFKELSQAAQELKTLKQQQSDAEAERLKKQGEFEKLAEQHKKEAEDAKAQVKTMQINNALFVAASKLGAQDAAVVAKLVDQDKLTIDDNGNVSGAEEALKALQQTSPYLFTKGASTQVGGGDSNGAGGNDSEFTFSQFKDASFYKENQAAMDKAMKDGRVDMSR